MEIRTKIVLFSCLSVLAAFIVLWDRSKGAGTTEAGTPVDQMDLTVNPDKGSGAAGTLVSGTGKTGPGEGAVTANPSGTTGVADPGKGAVTPDSGTPETGPDTLVMETPEHLPPDGATGTNGAGNTRPALPGEGIVDGHPDGNGGTGTHETGQGATTAVPEEEHPEPTSYRVKSGDSPYKIAEKIYGDGNKYGLILEANKGKVNAQGTNLRVGMELVIPPLPGRTPAVHEEKPTPEVAVKPEEHGAETVASGKTVEYVIQPGDSLSRISQMMYGTPSRWNEIYEANTDRLSSPDDLTVGETITIPGAK